MSHVSEEKGGEGGEKDDERSRESDREGGGHAAWMRALRDVAPYLDLGWRLAGTAAFPPLIGVALDAWLHTTPWGLLGGCGFGIAGSIVQLRRLQEEFGS